MGQLTEQNTILIKLKKKILKKYILKKILVLVMVLKKDCLKLKVNS